MRHCAHDRHEGASGEIEASEIEVADARAGGTTVARCVPCRRAVERGLAGEEEFAGRVRRGDVAAEPHRRRAYLHAGGAMGERSGGRRKGLDARAGATGTAIPKASIYFLVDAQKRV